MRVEDGKVVEGRDYCDSSTFLRQLGLMENQMVDRQILYADLGFTGIE